MAGGVHAAADVRDARQLFEGTADAIREPLQQVLFEPVGVGPDRVRLDPWAGGEHERLTHRGGAGEAPRREAHCAAADRQPLAPTERCGAMRDALSLAARMTAMISSTFGGSAG
jgi:hypothetical protein